MGTLLSRSVEIQISNQTRNITLRKPRTYFNCGRRCVPPLPELPPGCIGSCRFGGSYLWGVAGILVYEAESFTLAIHFSNPIDYNKFSMELGLELSPGKAHLGSLKDTYTRMAYGTYSSSCADIKFKRGVVDNSGCTAELRDRTFKVTATMSSATNSRLNVVLVEQEGSVEEAGTENPCEGDAPRRSENLRDLQGDLVDSPGTAWMA